MASIRIDWDTETLNATKTYAINVYRSTSGESSDYSLIGTTTPPATTYTDASGERNYFYYVRYQPSSESEGSIVLANIEATVTELRLAREVNEVLPKIIRSDMDTRLRQVRIAVQQALNAVNISSPTTSYTIENMPKTYETVVKLGAQIFIYCEQYLGVAIKDFSYAEGGISLNKDRGSKIATAIDKVLVYYNQLLKQVKLSAWPSEGIGLGSIGMSSPSQRILGILYNLPG